MNLVGPLGMLRDLRGTRPPLVEVGELEAMVK
jgi:hypothetical protein